MADLQRRLAAAGHSPGDPAGEFGESTAAAVSGFQQQAGLRSDGVCDTATWAALVESEFRLGDRLRRTMRSLTSLRVAIGSDTDLQPVTTRLAAALQSAGVTTVLLDGDWSAQAAEANDFAADVYLGLSLAPATVIEASYFEVPGFASTGGRHLAELVVRELPASPGWGIGAVTGMRLPILRETRSSAVLVQLGDRAMVDRNRDLIIASLQRALDVWASDPVAEGPSATSETPGPARYPGVAS